MYTNMVFGCSNSVPFIKVSLLKGGLLRGFTAPCLDYIYTYVANIEHSPYTKVQCLLIVFVFSCEFSFQYSSHNCLLMAYPFQSYSPPLSLSLLPSPFLPPSLPSNHFPTLFSPSHLPSLPLSSLPPFLPLFRLRSLPCFPPTLILPCLSPSLFSAPYSP